MGIHIAPIFFGAIWIEMLFDCPNEIEGGTYVDWAHGVVKEVVIVNQTEYCSKRLFKWLVDTVIPMADTRLAPDEHPVTMPSPPKMHKLGTTSKLAENLKSGNTDKQQQLKDGACKKQDDMEEREEGDR